MNHIGEVKLLYDNGETERFYLNNENWHFSHDKILSTSFVKIQSDDEVPKNVDKEPTELDSMKNYFQNKAFMLHQAQGFEKYPVINAYKSEEGSVLKTVKPIF